jgi:glycosyltransferase involved in cell wall biosynthesis
VIEPLVTIVIPFKDRFELVDRAVSSILNQTYSNWELILVDDASSQVYSQQHDPRISIHRNQVNRGPSYSRQRAASMAKGDFICFLDSDDYYDWNFLLKSVQAHLAAFRPVAFTYSTSAWVSSKNEIEGTYKTSDKTYSQILPDLFIHNRPWNTSSLLWNREYIPKLNLTIRTWEDYVFEFMAGMNNNYIIHIPDVLCYIYLDNNSGLSKLSDEYIGIHDRSKALQIISTTLQRSNGYGLKLSINIYNRCTKELIRSFEFSNSRYTSKRLFLMIYRHPEYSFIKFRNLSYYLIYVLCQFTLGKRVTKRILTHD